MQIRVNGKAHEVAATTLAALLAELDYQDKLVATAVNQSFVRVDGSADDAAQSRRCGRNSRAAAGRLISDHAMQDTPFQVYGTTLASRLLIGTAQYPSPAILAEAVKARAPNSSPSRCGARRARAARAKASGP